MLKEPVLTMPSSRLQPSERVYWKYRSASSTWCALISFERTGQMGFIQAKGREQRALGRGQPFDGGFARADHWAF